MNWEREFGVWAPHLNVVPVYGDQASRGIIRQYEITNAENGQFRCDVLLTTYERVSQEWKKHSFEPKILSKLGCFQSIIVDEGHRLKGGDHVQVVRALSSLKTSHRILLTGTPLQNNLQELYSILHYLNPKVFPAKESFSEISNQEDLARLKALVEPFILRRTKWDVKLDIPPKVEIEVPVGLSSIQTDCYAALLSRNFQVLREGRKTGVRNVLMELRKCCNHAMLVSDIGSSVLENQRNKILLAGSGKFALLNQMLPRLQEAGHRVLIFSQFKIVLDLLEEFVLLRDYPYERIDGDVSGIERQRRIDR